MLKIITLALFLLAPTFATAASAVSFKGQGTAVYSNIIGPPDRSALIQAEQAAVNDGILKALSLQSEGLKEGFLRMGAALTVGDMVNRGIVAYKLQGDPFNDPSSKSILVTVAGNLNVTALRDYMNSLPANSPTNIEVNLSDMEAAVFFTVRSTAENIVQIEGRSSQSSITGNKEAEGTQVAEGDTVSSSEQFIKQGKESYSESISTKEDVQKYKLDSPSRELFGSGLLARFASKGFNSIVDGAMFESSGALDEAYGSGNSVPAKVWKSVADEVRESEPNVKYLIVGTLDFSIPTADEVTGQPLYSGTVSGKVYKLQPTGMPRVVAALEPQEVKFPSATQQDAKKRVVSQLAEQAADDIITKLRNKAAL